MEILHIPDSLKEAIHNMKRVSGLTHDFYKYPARFSPEFVRAAIQTFTTPGELVFDPFAGGGTTLVEAYANGREAIGLDINSLACFIAKVKTAPLSKRDVDEILGAESKITGTSLRHWDKEEEVDAHYTKNMIGVETWRIRKFLVFAKSVSSRTSERPGNFLKLVTLRTGQWALDNRKIIPSVAESRQKFSEHLHSMLMGMREFRQALDDTEKVRPPRAVNLSVIGAERRLRPKKKAALVLTSPPYPGVHLLYHRWQICGRQETPFPYWLANSLDGQGSSYYNLGSRHEEGLNAYFQGILSGFKSIAKFCEKETVVVQMVAFSEPDWQLPRYLCTMEEAGFKEMSERILRTVPNRKWYTNLTRSESTKTEVVLFHKIV